MFHTLPRHNFDTTDHFPRPPIHQATQHADDALPAAAAAAASLDTQLKSTRLVGKDALLKILGVKNMSFILGRNLALHQILVVRDYFNQLLEAENEADRTGSMPAPVPYPREKSITALFTGCMTSAMQIAVELVRCFLDWQASIRLSASLAHKLIKEIPASAARKAAKYTWYIRGLRLAKTAFYSDATFRMADVIVVCSLEAAMAWQARRELATLGVSTKRTLKLLAMRTAMHAVRGGAALLSVASACGVAAMMPYGRNHFLIILPLGATFIVNLQFYTWIDIMCPPPLRHTTTGRREILVGGGDSDSSDDDGDDDYGRSRGGRGGEGWSSESGSPWQSGGGESSDPPTPAPSNSSAGPSNPVPPPQPATLPSSSSATAIQGESSTMATTTSTNREAAVRLQAARLQDQGGGREGGGGGRGEMHAAPADEPPIPTPPEQRRRPLGGIFLPERGARGGAAGGRRQRARGGGGGDVYRQYTPGPPTPSSREHESRAETGVLDVALVEEQRRQQRQQQQQRDRGGEGHVDEEEPPTPPVPPR
jgi:hypothetical protein